jgi:hypothetical protein
MVTGAYILSKGRFLIGYLGADRSSFPIKHFAGPNSELAGTKSREVLNSDVIQICRENEGILTADARIY